MKDFTYNKKLVNHRYTIISILLLIILWQIIALGVNKEYLIPMPKATFISIINLLKTKETWWLILFSIKRTFISFVLSFIIAFILGLFSSLYPIIYKLIQPIIVIIRSTPTITIIIILLVLFGGEKAAIAIGFCVIFPMLYSNVVEGFHSVDYRLVEMANSFKVKKIRIIKDIYIPSIRSYILASMDAAIGLNFKVMISAEVIGEVYKSVGKNISIHYMNFEMNYVFAWTIILICIVALFNYIFSKIIRYFKG